MDETSRPSCQHGMSVATMNAAPHVLSSPTPSTPRDESAGRIGGHVWYEADADQVTVRLRDGSRVRIDVTDDGVGFDAANRPQSSGGLSIMQYRADLIGARLTLKSEPQKGTTITCELPLKQVKQS